MEEVLRSNEFMEFFIEGGRTRSGKATHPKSGLLSVIVDAFNAGPKFLSLFSFFFSPLHFQHKHVRNMTLDLSTVSWV